MGAVLTKLLQRALPALKEHQKTIEILQNQDVFKTQQIAMLEEQKAVLEKHVVDLSGELELAQTNSKRMLVVGGLCAVGAWLYTRRIQEEPCDVSDSSDDDTDDCRHNHNHIEIPDCLECIVCMENPKEVMLEPCGHVCICATCADTMRLPGGRVKCPVCRIRAETRTVYIT